MAKKAITQRRAQRRAQEDLTLRRVFYVFLIGLAAECYLLLVNRGYINGTVKAVLGWHSVLTVGTYAGLALFLLGGGAAVWKRQDKRIFRWCIAAASLGLFFLLSGWIMTTFFTRGVRLMCALVPIVTLLALVFLLFQRECFVSTVVLAAAMLVNWAFDKGENSSWSWLLLAGAVAAVVLVAALAGLTVKIKAGGGKLGGLQVLSGDCDYRILFAIYAVGALAMIVSVVVSGATYYLMWALGALLFAVLAYYTTKLM